MRKVYKYRLLDKSFIRLQSYVDNRKLLDEKLE